LSSRRNNIVTSDNLDSKLLFFAIIAIVITNFIVRIKIFKNIRDFDMSRIPNVSNFFTYYKLVWILIVTIILMLLLIFKIFKYKQKIKMDYVILGTGLIITTSIICFILDPIEEVTIWGFYSRSNGLLAYISLFLLIYIISRLKVQSKHLAFLVHSINLVSIVLVIIGIFQFFGFDMLNSLWYKKIYVPYEYKHLIDQISITLSGFTGTEHFWATSLLGQFNYFGAFCSITFPLISLFVLIEDNSIKRMLLMLGSVMLFVGTILAQSMGSIITIFLVLILIPILQVNKNNYKSIILMYLCYIIASVIINSLTNGMAFLEIYKLASQILNSKLIALVILLSAIYTLLFIFREKVSKHRYIIVSILIIAAILIGIIGYMYVISNVVEQNMGMLTRRGYIWYYSAELVKENFVFGYGPDNLYYNFPQMNPHKNYMQDLLIDKPHNMYLQVLLDTGIFGLIGFMILLVGLLLKSNKAIDLEEDLYKKTYFKALMLVIMAYMIQGMVNDNHMTIQPTVYLIMGIGASLIKQTLDKAKLSTTKK
jgi:hypothetical protein